MRNAYVSLLLALAFVVGPYSASAQSLTACINGTASGYECAGVDLGARVATGTSGPLRSGATNDIWGWTDPQTNREYALVGTLSGTVFVDVTDPSEALVLGKLPTQTGNSTWRDLKTFGHYVFVASEASNHGMQVFDLTRLRGLTADPTRDFTNDAYYNGSGGNRPGDAHNIVINEDSGFAFLVGSDDCSGGLHMVDINDPLNPTFAGCFSADGYTHDAQCITYDGPDTDYTGHEICAAYNEDSIAFVDVTDKASPTLISKGFYPNTGYTHQGWFTDDRRYILVDDETDSSSGGTRTYVLNVSDLDSPEYAFLYTGTQPTRDHNLYIRGRYAYLSNYEGGLRILDLIEIDNNIITEVAYFDTYPGGQSPSGWDGQWSNYPFFASGNVIVTDQNNGLFVLRPNLETTPTAVEAPGPSGFTLSPPSPNPTRGTTTFTLSVAEPQHVLAEVFDLAGRRVATLQDGPARAGAPLTLSLNGADLPAGLYLVRVTGESFSTTTRVSILH